MRRTVLEAAAFTQGSKTLPIVVQKISPINKQFASLLFTLGTGVSQERASEKNVAEGVTKLYGGRVRYVDGTLVRATEDANVLRMVVASNRPTVPYETASGEGWTMVSANTFADESDQLWEVSANNDMRVLRRIGDDDLSAVLEERRSRSIATAAAMVDMRAKADRHDAVVFFDTAAEEVAFGIALGNDKAYVHDEAGKSRIADCVASSILCITPHDSAAPQFVNAPALEQASTSVVLDYYKRLYGHNSAFYAKLKELVQQHLSV